jgi:hypothetical protein
MESHVHEGCGHPGNHLEHPALIDIAGGVLPVGALHVDFRQAAVFY